MTKTIPPDLIAHLQWQPGGRNPAPPRNPNPVTPPNPARTNPIMPSGSFTIEDLLKNGKDFYSEEKDSDNKHIGVPKSLAAALEYATADGLVASLPYLVAGMATADKRNYLWKNWHTALTEEDAGIDKKGIFTRRGEGVVLVLHGGGILNTPERIFKAYSDGLTPQNTAKYTNEEFDNLLEGKLPSGEEINICTVDDLRSTSKKLTDPFGRYAVAIPIEKAQEKDSGYLNKTDFMNNDLVLARAGTLEYLEKYFDKAVSGGTVGSWHRFSEIDPSQPQGRVLYVVTDSIGLIGNFSLGDDASFVGVAPEARRPKKGKGA